MHPFFIYLLQVNIALTLFFILYAIVLKKDTFLKLRRFYFLSTIFFSLLYPFWTIPAFGDFWVSAATQGNPLATVSIEEPGLAVLADADTIANVAIPWAKIIVLIYSVIVFAFLMRFISQLLSILRVKMKSEKRIISGMTVYQLKDNITPFSFFNRIFIHPNSYSETELSQILLHEQTHVRQHHSLDIMLIELLCLFSWWNPFVWMMKREMVINLEFLADNGVLREGIDCREYQYHLLRLTYHESAIGMVNNFNVSQLKQRIMMMNKSKSPTLTLVKYILILPLAFLLIFANSCINNEMKNDAETTEEQVDNESATRTVPEEENVIEDNSEVFVVVEEQPEFPGGQAAMMRFLADSIKYPVAAQENGIHGRVVCNFIVEKDGRLTDFKVLRGVDPLLDNEAIRILKAMPKWTPGKQRGENVRVRFTLPVVFRLMGVEELAPPPPPSTPIRESGSDDIFVAVDTQPEFPGGQATMMRWLSDNIKYPAVAQENGIDGRVVVNFIVEKDGTLSDVNVIRGVDPSLDKEAVRVIQSMPNWKPGMQKNEAVRVRYALPVVFRLQK